MNNAQRLANCINITNEIDSVLLFKPAISAVDANKKKTELFVMLTDGSLLYVYFKHKEPCAMCFDDIYELCEQFLLKPELRRSALLMHHFKQFEKVGLWEGDKIGPGLKEEEIDNYEFMTPKQLVGG